MEKECWIKDKNVMITGANSGIGKKTALELNRRGAKVIMMCRNENRALKARDAIIEDTGNPDIEIIFGDLADLNSIRKVATEFKKNHEKLHVLINNAGGIVLKKQLTVDGFERTWATNYLGHFLLTMLLLDVIKASSPSRIINITSVGHKFASKTPLEDMNYENKRYKHMKAYGNSKLMILWATYELARRLEGTGVTVNAVHPGIINTKFGRRGNPWWFKTLYRIGLPFFKSSAKGARTSIYLATASEVAGITGKYWVKCKEKKSSHQSYNKASQKRLWEISEKFINMK